jgi:hypothetical protein
MASSPEPQRVECKYRQTWGALRQQYFAKMTEKQERRRLKQVQSEIASGVLEPSERAPKRPRRRVEILMTDESRTSIWIITILPYHTTRAPPVLVTPPATYDDSPQWRWNTAMATGGNRHRKKLRTASAALTPTPDTYRQLQAELLGSRRADTESHIAFGIEIGRDGTIANRCLVCHVVSVFM